ncbi:alcohol dehydrogenase catalytic domain-containing protein [Paenarthrobacter aromaticivorans]|uniref:alcohol dehydrogenase catalytic domain-containing protein n=1 Tax=Paenarthrobacter aromaticivorans TaxID=2849150 RepID=UPI003A7FE131
MATMFPAAHAAVRASMDQRSIEVRMREIPQLHAGEVLVQTEYCGLCGSDLHIWNGDDGYGWVPCGTVLGHEIVGRIVRSDDPGGLKPGTRVVAIAQSGCGSCPACMMDYANGCPDKVTLGLTRDGGAARFVAIPATQLLAVPHDVPAGTAVLTEPLSVAARAVADRGGVTAADTVVVSGPGTIGILSALVCRHLGARVVLKGTAQDVAARGGLADRLGLDLVETLPPGFKPNVWIEAAGASSALADAVRELPAQGRLVVVALYGAPPALAANDAVRKELDITTSYSSHRPDYQLALDILQTHPGLGDLLVETVPLTSIAVAFEKVGRGAMPKIAVEP